jgi:uncharacterized protein YcbK (DUF882 family)
MTHQAYALRTLRRAYDTGGQAALDAACCPASSTLLSTPQGKSIWAETERRRKNAGIINFSTSEILYLGASHHSMDSPARGLNQLPTFDQLPTLVEIFRQAQRLRTELGIPLLNLSAYRHPRYNTAVGGAHRSFHTRAMAIDLAPASRGRENVQRLLATAKTLRTARQLNIGGIGAYASFIHIDHGPTRDF